MKQPDSDDVLGDDDDDDEDLGHATEKRVLNDDEEWLHDVSTTSFY
jgi:hypothetical protein